MTDRDASAKPEDRPADAPPVAADVPMNVRNIALTTLATIAAVLMLQYTQSVLIPIVIGILIAYALDPFVTGLARLAVPRSIGAAIVLVFLVGAIGIGVYSLTDQAMEIVSQI